MRVLKVNISDCLRIAVVFPDSERQSIKSKQRKNKSKLHFNLLYYDLLSFSPSSQVPANPLPRRRPTQLSDNASNNYSATWCSSILALLFLSYPKKSLCDKKSQLFACNHARSARIFGSINDFDLWLPGDREIPAVLVCGLFRSCSRGDVNL